MDIGDRMKQYENCYRIYLPRRSAIIVRLDMRAGHNFTKGFLRPYDKIFSSCMRYTMRKLCENMSGARFGYHQSDEISIVLADYENINTEPWFSNNLQKIVSISASMAALFFKEQLNQIIFDLLYSWSNLDWNNKEEMKANEDRLRELYGMPPRGEEWDRYVDTIQTANSQRMATFDSRAFILPREEVVNYFYFRQLDCIRNSIQMAGQSNFSHRELQNKNCNEIQEMLFSQKGINWAKDYSPEFRNGSACYKKLTDVITPDGTTIQRNKWFIDKNIPKFSAEPDFINKHIIFNKE